MLDKSPSENNRYLPNKQKQAQKPHMLLDINVRTMKVASLFTHEQNFIPSKRLHIDEENEMQLDRCFKTLSWD